MSDNQLLLESIPGDVFDGTKAPSRTYKVFDLETVPDSFWQAETEDDFPPIPAHRVVCVGNILVEVFRLPDGNLLHLPRSYESRCMDDEPALISAFLRSLEYINGLVSWNGRGFDVPVIMSRSMIYGVVPTKSRLMTSPRYNSDHIDLCDMLSNYGASKRFKLDATARMLGLEGKSEVGSHVGLMWQHREYQRIAEYCMRDCFLTMLIYWRLRGLKFSWECLRSGIGNPPPYLAAHEIPAWPEPSAF